MKLLQINTVINSGSTGRIAEEIGQIAIKNGWESYIAFGRNDRPSKSHKIKVGNKYDMFWHGIKTRIFDAHGFASTRATKKLIKQIENIAPNIIHLHNIHGYYLNVELLFDYLAKTDVPVVWTLHDCWPFTGHCSHFSFIRCKKWITHCYDCPQKREYPASVCKDNSYKNYDSKRKSFTSVKNMTIVTVSQWLESVVQNSFLKNSSIKIILNGVDLNVFKYVEDDYFKNKYNLHDKFVMLGVANVWNRKKGLLDFIELSKLLQPDETIILIGLTDKQIKELPDNIIGLTRTENVDDLVKLYSTADIVLNLSVEETFGLTTVEGFACGKPGIVYNTTASPELISDDTGFIVPQGDIHAVRSKISEIRNKGKFFYNDNCRKRAEEYYGKEDRYKEYMKLYKKLT